MADHFLAHEIRIDHDLLRMPYHARHHAIHLAHAFDGMGFRMPDPGDVMDRHHRRPAKAIRHEGRLVVEVDTVCIGAGGESSLAHEPDQHVRPRQVALDRNVQLARSGRRRGADAAFPGGAVKQPRCLRQQLLQLVDQVIGVLPDASHRRKDGYRIDAEAYPVQHIGTIRRRARLCGERLLQCGPGMRDHLRASRPALPDSYIQRRVSPSGMVFRPPTMERSFCGEPISVFTSDWRTKAGLTRTSIS